MKIACPTRTTHLVEWWMVTLQFEFNVFNFPSVKIMMKLTCTLLNRFTEPIQRVQSQPNSINVERGISRQDFRPDGSETKKLWYVVYLTPCSHVNNLSSNIIMGNHIGVLQVLCIIVTDSQLRSRGPAESDLGHQHIINYCLIAYESSPTTFAKSNRH